MAGRALSGEQWVIAADGHQATVVEVGGGLRGYTVDGEPALETYGEHELCPGGCGAQLAPWPNRTGDGRYTFQGREYQLALSEPARHNAIHGLVRWMPWRRVSAGADGGRADAVTVACDLPAHPGYPWPLALTTRYVVSAHGLRVEHSATNLGEAPAPFGLGCHPYLRRSAPADELVLSVPADSRLRKDDRGLPAAVRPVEPVAGSPEDFSTPRAIGAAALDATYTDLRRSDAGTVEIGLSTSDGDAVQLWADESFRWIQVFTGDTLPEPRRRRAVAVEPMTCPPDALRTGRDLITLEPGETWRGSWGVRTVSRVTSSDDAG